MGFFDKLKSGLGKTKQTINEKINDVFSNFRKVDEELLEELEEALIMSDIGIETSTKIINELRIRVKKENIQDEENVRKALKEEMVKLLDIETPELKLATTPSVILVVGVNGVGKTTSIGKIANSLRKSGKKVVIAAADTFRAAAVEQIEICTAGRLHNKKNLIDELGKINKVINKELPDASKEVLLLLDGTTGQNAIMQVKAFKETTDITGIVLTKLDGTAKGGVVVGIVAENHIPVKYIGVGEQIDDMEVFNSSDFIDAII